LLIPNTDKNKGIITGKLFEYLSTGRFVLGIGAKGGDAEKILNKTDSGKVFDYTNNLENIILKLYDSWKNESEIKIDKSNIEQYSRKNLTKKLATIFDQTVNN